MKILYKNQEQTQNEEEILEGEVVDEDYSSRSNEWAEERLSEEEKLRRRIEDGEWDNLDECSAFQKRTLEGQIMLRTEAIDLRIRQLEKTLPILLNRDFTAAYVQVLKRIRSLRLTKTAILELFYKNLGQRDIDRER